MFNNIKAAIIGTGIGLGILASIFGPDASTSYGPITEDDPHWSCSTMGNHVCGPTNDEGMPAGCYDHEGVLVVLWPCESWMA